MVCSLRHLCTAARGGLLDVEERHRAVRACQNSAERRGETRLGDSHAPTGARCLRLRRLLVGLRWWNEVKDDGTNEWIYESRPVCACAVPVRLLACRSCGPSVSVPLVGRHPTTAGGADASWVSAGRAVCGPVRVVCVLELADRDAPGTALCWLSCVFTSVNQLWFGLGIAAIFGLKLQWLLVGAAAAAALWNASNDSGCAVAVALTLSCANLYGYYKCQKGAATCAGAALPRRCCHVGC
jgi:hypothetical protein